MIPRVLGGLVALAASVVLGFFGFQAYLDWLQRGQSVPADYDQVR